MENKKTRGRPKSEAPKGRGAPTLVRWDGDELTEIDNWRAQQRPIPSRPEAIRQLAKLGLRKK